MNKKIILLSIFLVLILAIGCSEKKIPQPAPIINTPVQTANQDQQEPSQDIRKFNSIEEVSAYLQKNSQRRSYNRGGFAEMALSSKMMATADAVGVASDFSQTNVQVKGVDEADFVKNDGKYIYTLSGSKVVILDAYPPENARILSEIDLNNSYAQEIFINGDKLVVFGTEYIYKKYADQLIASGNAYYAFDSPKELDVLRKEAEEIKETFTYNAATRGQLKNSLTLSFQITCSYSQIVSLSLISPLYVDILIANFSSYSS